MTTFTFNGKVVMIALAITTTLIATPAHGAGYAKICTDALTKVDQAFNAIGAAGHNKTAVKKAAEDCAKLFVSDGNLTDPFWEPTASGRNTIAQVLEGYAGLPGTCLLSQELSNFLQVIDSSDTDNENVVHCSVLNSGTNVVVNPEKKDLAPCVYSLMEIIIYDIQLVNGALPESGFILNMESSFDNDGFTSNTANCVDVLSC